MCMLSRIPKLAWAFERPCWTEPFRLRRSMDFAPNLFRLFSFHEAVSLRPHLEMAHITSILKIGMAKSDSLIGIKLDLLILEGATFDIADQVVGNDHYGMRVGFTEMGAPFDPGGHLIHQPLEVFLLQSGR